jgi:hypothetical protein
MMFLGTVAGTESDANQLISRAEVGHTHTHTHTHTITHKNTQYTKIHNNTQKHTKNTKTLHTITHARHVGIGSGGFATWMTQATTTQWVCILQFPQTMPFYLVINCKSHHFLNPSLSLSAHANTHTHTHTHAHTHTHTYKHTMTMSTALTAGWHACSCRP